MSNDPSINHFLKTFEKKKKEEQSKQTNLSQIQSRKAPLLIPVRLLLKKFMDAGIVVVSSEKFHRFSSYIEPVPFEVHEGPSSPSWAPGTSLFFDNPALVEIAIPNELDIKDYGVVCVRVASQHPDSHMLHKKFNTPEEACHAISNFLAKNTVDVKNPEMLQK